MRFTAEDLAYDSPAPGSAFFGLMVLFVVVILFALTLWVAIGEKGWKRGISEHQGVRLIAPFAGLIVAAAVLIKVLH